VRELKYTCSSGKLYLSNWRYFKQSISEAYDEMLPINCRTFTNALLKSL
jgi:hypothetical protein